MTNLQSLNIETKENFIIIIDEWDYVISANKFTYEERNRYISFIQYLLKNQIYNAFTYMTGILPIAKRLSHSTLNCFKEYLMLKNESYYQ